MKQSLKRRYGSISETASLLKGNPIVVSGSIIAALIILIAIAAPFVVNPNTITTVNLGKKLLPPGSQHWLGTDGFGRDLLGVLLLSTSYDLLAATVILLVSSTVGVLLGSVAGYFGGKTDEVIMRVTDIFLALPSLVLAMAIAAVLGRSLTNLVLAVIVVLWAPICRLIRGQAIAEKGKLYVDSLRVLGFPRRRIILRHLIPNTIYPVLIYITTQVGLVILTFAGLNYIGFGPSLLTPEWGELIATGQTYIFQDPTVVIFPGIAIFITAMAFNLLGDGLRDIFDPKLRN